MADRSGLRSTEKKKYCVLFLFAKHTPLIERNRDMNITVEQINIFMDRPEPYRYNHECKVNGRCEHGETICCFECDNRCKDRCDDISCHLEFFKEVLK